jgi:hypothetical protein
LGEAGRSRVVLLELRVRQQLHSCVAYP